MRLWIFDHAVLRFQERVRPGLDFVAASKELRRLVEACGERVEKPSWAPRPDPGRYYVRICDDVLLLVEPPPERTMLPRAVTVIVRGMLHPDERESRNRRRRNRAPKRARTLAARDAPSSRRDYVPPMEDWSSAA